jgi:AbrB family looped-hinge helix DNA binding protein
MSDDVLVPKLVSVTSKMQFTIPKRMRDRLGLRVGDKVNLGIEKGAIILSAAGQTTRTRKQKRLSQSRKEK